MIADAGWVCVLIFDSTQANYEMQTLIPTASERCVWCEVPGNDASGSVANPPLDMCSKRRDQRVFFVSRSAVVGSLGVFSRVRTGVRVTLPPERVLHR